MAWKELVSSKVRKIEIKQTETKSGKNENTVQIFWESWNHIEWPNTSAIKDPGEREEGRILRDNSWKLFKNNELNDIDFQIGFKMQDPIIYCNEKSTLSISQRLTEVKEITP